MEFEKFRKTNVTPERLKKGMDKGSEEPVSQSFSKYNEK